MYAPGHGPAAERFDAPKSAADIATEEAVLLLDQAGPGACACRTFGVSIIGCR